MSCQVIAGQQASQLRSEETAVAYRVKSYARCSLHNPDLSQLFNNSYLGSLVRSILMSLVAWSHLLGSENIPCEDCGWNSEHQIMAGGDESFKLAPFTWHTWIELFELGRQLTVTSYWNQLSDNTKVTKWLITHFIVPRNITKVNENVRLFRASVRKDAFTSISFCLNYLFKISCRLNLAFIPYVNQK